jgi:hypothetical protein
VRLAEEALRRTWFPCSTGYATAYKAFLTHYDTILSCMFPVSL